MFKLAFQDLAYLEVAKTSLTHGMTLRPAYRWEGHKSVEVKLRAPLQRSLIGADFREPSGLGAGQAAVRARARRVCPPTPKSTGCLRI